MTLSRYGYRDNHIAIIFLGRCRFGSRRPNLTPPSTGDTLAMAEYEEAVTEFLLTALKRS